jgi:hypothetical protein
MNEEARDRAADSVPQPVKFAVSGRNFTAKRVPLGQRLELARFYFKLMGPVVGELGATTDPMKQLEKILSRLPDLLSEIDKEGLDIIAGCTNIPPDFLENSVELEDLYVILRKIAEANNFMRSIKSIVSDVKKNAPQGGETGSKG